MTFEDDSHVTFETSVVLDYNIQTIRALELASMQPDSARSFVSKEIDVQLKCH
jgi:hypothetical protein